MPPCGYKSSARVFDTDAARAAMGIVHRCQKGAAPDTDGGQVDLGHTLWKQNAPGYPTGNSPIDKDRPQSASLHQSQPGTRKVTTYACPSHRSTQQLKNAGHGRRQTCPCVRSGPTGDEVCDGRGRNDDPPPC